MSRFEERLQRDLHVIADRATPSSNAWDEIQHRIETREPITDPEVIMLTDNTTTARRWPIIAAAAALIIVAVTAIVVIGTGGEHEQVPADRVPSETAPPASAVATTPAAEPRTFDLAGTMTGAAVFAEPDADGNSTYHATEDWAGDLTGTATSMGSVAGNEAGDGLTGTSRLLLDGSLPGVGDGVLIIEDEWSSAFTGRTDGTGRVVGGTGAFEGASGTFTASSPDGANDPDTPAVEIGGGWTLELVLPAEQETPATTRTLTLEGATAGSVVFELPEEGSGDPGILIGSTDYSGGLSGTGTSLGEALPNEAADGLDGRTRHVVDATVEGVGSGLLVIDTVWSSKFTGSVESTGTIVGGTGAFEGATGTITESAPEGSNDPSTDEVEAGGPYTIELTVRDADG